MERFLTSVIVLLCVPTLVSCSILVGTNDLSTAKGGSSTFGDASSGNEPSSCSDRLLSEDETDVDCGGANVCKRCDVGQRCLADSDCRLEPETLLCVAGTCRRIQAGTCSDGSLTGDETDVDCGGSCEKCPNERSCLKNEDCQSHHCSQGTCESPPFGPDDAIVFATSQLYAADLGGLASADAECQALAQSAKLRGTYKAFLSDSSTSASNRLSRAAGAYKRVDGAVIAENADTFFSLAHNIGMDLDEMGRPAPGEVWTASNGAGAAQGSYCSDWTSQSGTAIVGLAERSDSRWANVYLQFCERTNVRLYCVEQ